jgi:hypothetical protein
MKPQRGQETLARSTGAKRIGKTGTMTETRRDAVPCTECQTLTLVTVRILAGSRGEIGPVLCPGCARRARGVALPVEARV